MRLVTDKIIIFRAATVVPVPYYQFQKVLKRLSLDIGLDSRNYSSHSFREDGVSWAFAAEVAPRVNTVIWGLER